MNYAQNFTYSKRIDINYFSEVVMFGDVFYSGYFFYLCSSVFKGAFLLLPYFEKSSQLNEYGFFEERFSKYLLFACKESVYYKENLIKEVFLEKLKTLHSQKSIWRYVDSFETSNEKELCSIVGNLFALNYDC